jgi:long-chain fatty acid transport protein
MSEVGSRVDVAGTYFKPTVKYTATGGASGTEQESDRAASFIPTLGVIYGIGDRLSVGLGVVGVSGMGVDYPADLYGSTTMTSYMNLRVAPAASYKINDQFAVGVAANLMYATMEYAVAGAPTSVNMEPRKSTGAIGYGATIGLTYKPMKELTVGLAYETKSFFSDFEWNIPSHTINTPGGPVTVPGGKEKLAFDQPQMITLGASYQVMDALLVAADVEWINWSSTNGKDMPEFTSDPNMTGAMKWNMNWSDQVVVKVGAQYAATKELKIRAGYNYGKMPLDADRGFENIAFPAVAEHHVSLGAGYDIGKLTVNVAGVYSPEATLKGQSPLQNLPTYETKMSQVAIDLGVGYKF